MSNDIFFRLNSYLTKRNYENLTIKGKMDLIEKGLKIYLSDKIKEAKPDINFDGTNLSIESLIIVSEDITKDSTIGDMVVHYLLSCVNGIQGYEIVWYVSEEDKYKGIPNILVNKDGKIDKLITHKEETSAYTFKFLDDSVDNILKLDRKNSYL